MKPLQKYIVVLAVLELIVLLAGFFLTSNLNTGLRFTDIVILSIVFSLLGLLVLIIFFRGQNRDPASQTMHSLVSVSSKFLLELVFIFFWFFIAKKTGLSSVILFFVIYLTFTLFSVIVILKTLKNKSL